MVAGKWFIGLVAGVCTVAGAAAVRGASLSSDAPADTTAELGGRHDRVAGVGLGFEENVGQAPASVRFLVRGFGYSAYLGSSGISLLLGPAATDRLEMTLIGAERSVTVRGDTQLVTTSNYLLDSPRGGLRTGVPHYRDVTYDGVYPGVDLVFHGARGQLEYDFRLAAGADPSTIRFRLDGAEQLRLENGALVVRMGRHEVVHRAPIVFQEFGAVRRFVAGGYVLDDEGAIGFRVGDHDRSRPLIIDPVISAATYLGGTSLEFGHDIAVGPDGSAYVTGVTYSVDFPLAGPLQSAKEGLSDAFIAKLDPTGSQFVYVTYLGGSSEDTAWGIDVDDDGSAWVTGATNSADFPGAEGSLGGARDAFIAKLSPSGDALEFSLYVGGTSDDEGAAIDVGEDGRATLAGGTSSADFPTLAAVDDEFGGGTDAFVAQFDDAGTLLGSTYFGGSGFDRAAAIAMTGDGAYVSGTTSSADLLPDVRGAQREPAGSFAAKLDVGLADVLYATYVGDPSARTNFATAIGVDASGSAYIPMTMGAGGETGQLDVVVTKLDPDGTAFIYTSTLGGAGEDYGAGIAVDARGNAYLSGTASAGFPVLDPLPDAGDGSAFVATLDPDGVLLFASRFGGGDEGGSWSRGRGTALDGLRRALHVTGDTSATDFPTVRAPQSELAGLRDAFVVKIDLGKAEPEPPTPQGDQAETTLGVPVTIDVLANDSSSSAPLDPESVEVVAPPRSGRTAVDSVTGAVTYTPARGFIGSDQFEYQVCGGALCARASVNIEVEPPACTIVASPDQRLVVGTDADDVICGGEADETILSRGGDDVVAAGGGDDVVVGASGDDMLLGGDGDDVLLGHQGSDVLVGDAGDDILVGGSGDDLIVEGPAGEIAHLGQGDG